jgi:hypothetical protein
MVNEKAESGTESRSSLSTNLFHCSKAREPIPGGEKRANDETNGRTTDCKRGQKQQKIANSLKNLTGWNVAGMIFERC